MIHSTYSNSLQATNSSKEEAFHLYQHSICNHKKQGSWIEKVISNSIGYIVSIQKYSKKIELQQYIIDMLKSN